MSATISSTSPLPVVITGTDPTLPEIFTPGAKLIAHGFLGGPSEEVQVTQVCGLWIQADYQQIGAQSVKGAWIYVPSMINVTWTRANA